MKKLLYIIFITVLSMIIMLNIFSIFNIGFFGYRLFRVASGSMENYLRVGDLVLVKDDNEYKIGDIITYKKDNRYVTHRIIYMENDLIITRGDANNVNDEPINKSDVIGKMVKKLVILSFINKIVENPIFWIIVLIIGVSLIIMIPSYKKKNGKLIDNEIL